MSLVARLHLSLPSYAKSFNNTKVPKMPKVKAFCHLIKKMERSETKILGILAHFSSLWAFLECVSVKIWGLN